MRLHDLCTLGAELLRIEGLLVAGLLRRIRVEVEGVPTGGKSVVREGGAVLLDCAFEAVFADVAPGADGVGDDGDVVLGHCAGGCAESHGGWLLGWVVVGCCWWWESGGGVACD